MAKSISDIQKKPARGRPPKPEGRFAAVLFRFPRELLAAIDGYAQKSGIARSEAVRRLIEAGLKKAKSRG